MTRTIKCWLLDALVVLAFIAGLAVTMNACNQYRRMVDQMVEQLYQEARGMK